MEETQKGADVLGMGYWGGGRELSAKDRSMISEKSGRENMTEDNKKCRSIKETGGCVGIGKDTNYLSD